MSPISEYNKFLSIEKLKGLVKDLFFVHKMNAEQIKKIVQDEITSCSPIVE